MHSPRLSKSLRRFRSGHKIIGLVIAFLVFISAVTGVLLAFKKEADILQPPTQEGASRDLSEWKPLYELASIASKAFYDEFPEQEGNAVDRMDVQPSKGIVKVLFGKGWWEVQVDGATGEVKSIARRHADWIEQLHDGSIVSQGFKLVAMNVLGIGLLAMLATGGWLWYGPKVVRRRKSGSSSSSGSSSGSRQWQ
jgi:uncharacterized iron-regulated membrane protein